jgi:type I restriction enzyme M protein
MAPPRILDAACSILGSKKDFILQLIFTKQLRDVFDDEINRIVGEVGSRRKTIPLVNASQLFEKGYPKNYNPEEGIKRIADTHTGWNEEEKLSRIDEHSELKKNDFKISPSSYIHTSNFETYRPIAEIVEELNAIELEARETDEDLREILRQLGASA